MSLPRSFPWYYALLAIAESLTFIRERDANRPNSGEGVEACQHVTGNEPPASWCCSYATKNEVALFRKAWPLIRSGACEQVRRAYDAKGALLTHAQVREMLKAGELAGYPDLATFGAGWQFFSVSMVPDGKGGTIKHAHHTGLVGQLLMDGSIVAFHADGSFTTTEGNAADPKGKASDNGNGAYSGRVRGIPGRDKTMYEFGRIDLL